MLQVVRQKHSFEEYLALEEMSVVKHEYLERQVWAMAGGSPAHAAIAVNVASALREQLRGKGCRVFSSDLRIRVPATGLTTYPDVSVVCGPIVTDPADPKGHTVVNPVLVVEVLSPSAEEYDRDEKVEHYKRIPELREILLVEHAERRVQVWRREGISWSMHTIQDGGAFQLVSVGVELLLEDVYDDLLSS